MDLREKIEVGDPEVPTDAQLSFEQRDLVELERRHLLQPATPAKEAVLRCGAHPACDGLEQRVRGRLLHEGFAHV